MVHLLTDRVGSRVIVNYILKLVTSVVCNTLVIHYLR